MTLGSVIYTITYLGSTGGGKDDEILEEYRERSVSPTEEGARRRLSRWPRGRIYILTINSKLGNEMLSSVVASLSSL